MGAAFIVHCTLSLCTLEVFLPDEADTLNRRGLAEGVFIDRVGVTFQTPLTIFGKQHFYIQVAEERLIRDIIIPIAHITIDDESIDRLQLELRFVFLTGTGPFSFCTDSYTYSKYIRQFGQPSIDLARDS